jgi:hypothetical protein
MIAQKQCAVSKLTSKRTAPLAQQKEKKGSVMNKAPNDAAPYERLIVCSNTLYDGTSIVSINDELPLTICKGKIPRVWIKGLGKSKGALISLVEDSISKHPAIQVYANDGSINIKIANSNILIANNISNESAEVTFLDLRPIGLNIYGDKNSLNAAGNSLSNNSMRGGRALVGFNMDK